MVGVRQQYQKEGLGKKLYYYFIDYAKTKGCNKIKAITSATNKASILFHKKLGMDLLGKPNTEGVNVVQNYSGIGNDRVVFNLDI